MSLLKVEDLKVAFATPLGPLRAVRGVSFQVKQGETVCVVGESGSGKSVTGISLLNLLPGNASQLDGYIQFNGNSVLDLVGEDLRRFRGSSISMIFQEPGRSFDPIYSIEKTMAETLLAHFPNMSRTEVRQRSIQLLQEVKIPKAEERLKNFPHQFSGGLLQRIMIALALASDPKLLIADEPTTALDVTIQAEIIELLMDIKKRRDLAILFITHDLALVSEIADRIIVMYAGLVMEEGPRDDVLFMPRHPYTHALLNSVPKLGQHYTDSELTTIPGNVPSPFREESGCPFAPRCSFIKAECSKALPPLAKDSHFYRCIVPGVKNDSSN